MKRFLTGLKGRLDLLYREILQMDAIDLAARMTLCLLVLYSERYWYVRVPMIVFCVSGFLFRALTRSRAFWLVITLVMVWGNTLHWYTIDNHQYLMTYWCLALYGLIAFPRAEAALAINARWLIGLCFGFATLWKLISPDYLNGAFFHHALLTDGRFKDLAEILGKMTVRDLYYNRFAISELVRFSSTLDSVQLQGTPEIARLAHVITWWTVAIEGLVSAAFLGPSRLALYRWRHALLMLFAVTTYATAPVVGFGWLLMVMGVAQCEPERAKTRALYVATFFLIQVFTLPWRVLFNIVRLVLGW